MQLDYDLIQRVTCRQEAVGRKVYVMSFQNKQACYKSTTMQPLPLLLSDTCPNDNHFYEAAAHDHDADTRRGAPTLEA